MPLEFHSFPLIIWQTIILKTSIFYQIGPLCLSLTIQTMNSAKPLLILKLQKMPKFSTQLSEGEILPDLQVPDPRVPLDVPTKLWNPHPPTHCLHMLSITSKMTTLVKSCQTFII